MFDEIKGLHLRNLPVFHSLNEIQLKQISNVARVKEIYRGQNIDYGEGELSRIFFVLKGKIKISELDELDNELVKDILTEGEFFGNLELEAGNHSEEFAEALTRNAIVCYFTIADFKKILECNPLAALCFAREVSGKLKRMEHRHADLVFRDAKDRLIRFIKAWAKMDGSLVGDKIILNNYLTHSDIAAVISTSRQSVNVFLNELRDPGLLQYNRKQIELRDPRVWN
jgi:CRP/FNR family cyclic AMP-dependent transcriptional regulator